MPHPPRWLWMLIGLIGVVALALWPLFRSVGIAGSDDILPTLYRVFALRMAWSQGIFYPRLSPDLIYGYGAPLFHYYPPLASYLAAGWTLLGVDWANAVKYTFALALMVGGVGAYQLGRQSFYSAASGWLVALTYTLAPYQLTNLYVRGATAEAVALALFPWLLWLFRRLIESDETCQVRPQNLAVWAYFSVGAPDRSLIVTAPFLYASMLLAALLITHNGQSLFFLPILVIFCLLHGWQSGRWRAMMTVGAAMGLALAISAFFWLPAILERDAVNIDAMRQGYYDPLTHLTALSDLIQQNWYFDYRRPAAFRWGWLPTVLALLSLLTWRWQPPHRRLWLLFYALLVVVPIALQLPGSAPFWKQLPLVRFLQFPWRLFAFASLGSAWLIGAMVSERRGVQQESLETGRVGFLQNDNWAFGWAGVLSLLFALYALWGVGPIYRQEVARGLFQSSDINHRDLDERGQLGFELFTDYQPTRLQVAMSEIPNRPTVANEEAAIAAPTIQVTSDQGLHFAAQVTTPAPFTLQLHRTFFPGWQASIDGRPANLEAMGALGLVALTIPTGSHHVSISWQATPVRQIANTLSRLGACLWVAIAALFLRRDLSGATVKRSPVSKNFSVAPDRSVWRTSTYHACLLFSMIGVIGLLFAQPILQTIHPPRPISSLAATLGDSVQLIGYRLDRDSVRPGETLHLTLYWLALRLTPQAYKVFVHLRDPADTQMAGQHDSDPVYGFTPTTRWQPGEIVADVHPLTLDATVAPGRYLLTAGMYDPVTVQNLPVTSSLRLLPENRIVLGEVEVR